MRNLKMGKKFTLVFSVVIICFCIAVIVTISGMSNTGSKYRQFYENYHEAIVRSSEIHMNLQSAVKEVSLATVDSNEEHTKTFIADANTYMNGVKENLSWFKEHYRGNLDLMNQFEDQMNATTELRSQIMELTAKNTALASSQAQVLLTNEYNPKVEEAAETLISFSEQVQKAGDTDFTESMKLQSLLLLAAVIISLISLAIGIWMAVVLTRAVVSPVKEMQTAMEEIEKGNLKAQLSYHSRDELGQLADHMRAVMRFLQAVISDEGYVLSEMGSGNFKAALKLHHGWRMSMWVIMNP